MSTDVVLPPLGEATGEATMSRWLKAVGDEVLAGEPLLEVSTDKVDTEIPAPASGVLRQIFFNEDDIAAIGDVLAVIETVDDQSASPPDDQPASPQDEQPAYVTPQIRQLADKLGVDVTTVTGSGVGGRIRKQDLLDTSHPATPRVVDPRRGTACPLPPELTERAPQLSAAIELDAEQLPTDYLPALLAGVAAVLPTMADLNASVVGHAIVFHSQVNIGLAIDVDASPVVPVIKDADHLDTAQLRSAIDDLSARALNNTLTPPDCQDATFTVADFTAIGLTWATLPIDRLHVGALGVGRSVPRGTVWLTLGYDPRVVGPCRAASFLTRLRDAVTSR